MKTRLTLAALALALSPSLAAAMCSGHEVKQESASTCAAGETLDIKTGTCVKTTS